MEWEAVIGLEIHAQLATKSKIFSGASTAFGAEPNTQACAVDLALPGTLPVFNEEALRMAVKFGLAVDAEIGRKSVFDRKNYFYPDLPKGYQTSQLFHPIVGIGHIEITLEDGTTKRIGVTRAHVEDDAGKSLPEEDKLSEYDAKGLSADHKMAAYFEVIAKTAKDAKLAANWVMGELSKLLNQHDIDITNSPVSAEQLGGLLMRIKDDTISGKIAKQVFEVMWSEGGSADEIIESKGLKQVTDSGAIEQIVDEVIANNTPQVEQYVNAEPDKRGKMIGFFMGQVMKASQGKANPGQVQGVLKQKLAALVNYRFSNHKKTATIAVFLSLKIT